MMDDDDWGMMGGATTPGTGPSDPGADAPSRPDPQDGESGFPPGGMMGGRNDGR